MNDNLDDFLNSLGIEPTAPAVVTSVDAQQLADAGPAPVSEEPQTLSNEDFDDILEEYGFGRPQDAEAEEIHDGSDDETDWEEESEEEEEEVNNDEYNENIGEGRDLDVEEDADWDEAIASGRIVVTNETLGESEQSTNIQQTVQEVHFHMPDGEVIDVPILTEEEAARQAQELEATPQREPLIPLNSPTLLLDESTTRFSGAEWFNEIQKKSIIIAGCGGIGSNLVFQLARMVPASMVLYDDDTVEMVNMAGQLFARNDIGMAKVTAIANMITAYTNMQNIYAIQGKFGPTTEAGDIMMCGFDNMDARRTFFERWLEHVEDKPLEEQKNCLFLDGRLSLDTLQVLCIAGDDRFNINRYRSEFLFSDEEAEHTVCSMKQTTYLACMIGSVMTNLFTNFCANLLDPIIPYDLPFFTEYDAQNMIFKTEK